MEYARDRVAWTTDTPPNFNRKVKEHLTVCLQSALLSGLAMSGSGPGTNTIGKLQWSQIIL